MLKTIGAALLAVSVIATPVLAAGPAKNAGQPSATSQSQTSKTVVKPAAKSKVHARAHSRRHAWGKMMNANDKMFHRSHRKHHKAARAHHHHRKVVVIRHKARR